MVDAIEVRSITPADAPGELSTVDARLVHVDLPLNDPGVDAAVAALRGERFAFGAWMPVVALATTGIQDLGTGTHRPLRVLDAVTDVGDARALDHPDRALELGGRDAQLGEQRSTAAEHHRHEFDAHLVQ
jgi:hypothetical protein